jgi:hypothetical protein
VAGVFVGHRSEGTDEQLDRKHGQGNVEIREVARRRVLPCPPLIHRLMILGISPGERRAYGRL